MQTSQKVVLSLVFAGLKAMKSGSARNSRHTDDQWKIAKDQALCFRCLSNTHKGSSCRRFRECGN